MSDQTPPYPPCPVTQRVCTDPACFTSCQRLQPIAPVEARTEEPKAESKLRLACYWHKARGQEWCDCPHVQPASPASDRARGIAEQLVDLLEEAETQAAFASEADNADDGSGMSPLAREIRDAKLKAAIQAIAAHGREQDVERVKILDDLHHVLTQYEIVSRLPRHASLVTDLVQWAARSYRQTAEQYVTRIREQEAALARLKAERDEARLGLLVVEAMKAKAEAGLRASREALAQLYGATLLPEQCPHDNEVDICDACAYGVEKATAAARVHALLILKPAPPETGDPR